MKKLIAVFLILAALMPGTAAFAAIWYLRIPAAQADALVARLDVLKGPSPHTTHYTLPYESWMATETTVLLPIDERAEAVLTPEEWAERLSEMPPEFVRSIR